MKYSITAKCATAKVARNHLLFYSMTPKISTKLHKKMKDVYHKTHTHTHIKQHFSLCNILFLKENDR